MCAAHPVGALGSPGFVSPEVVHDAPHEPAMDIFSLGVVLFVMLVGRKPFSFQVSMCFCLLRSYVTLCLQCRGCGCSHSVTAGQQCIYGKHGSGPWVLAHGTRAGCAINVVSLLNPLSPL